MFGNNKQTYARNGGIEMGKKTRGKDRLVVCDSCGRRVPRDKSVSFFRTGVISTEMDTGENANLKMLLPRETHYCISCGKHRKIFQKKKRQQERLRERKKQGGRRPPRKKKGNE